MNTKIFIPILLTVISGCSVNPNLETVQEASGGGQAGAAGNKKLAALNSKINSTPRSETQKVPFERVEDILNQSSDTKPNDTMAFDEEATDDSFFSERKHKSKRDNADYEYVTKSTTVYEVPAYHGQPANGKPMLKMPKPSSAGNPSSYKVKGENYKVLPFSNGFVETGIASWYGSDFHGERTSNGEIYDMFGMTAAHKRLPIPSYVKVTNLKNKRSVVLRINDRGPFHDDRVIDLSYAAAQKLDVHQVGTERVKIEAIKTPHKESVYLQLGVFSNLAYAQILQKKVVDSKMPEPVIKKITMSGKVAYRVQLGPVFSTAKINEFNEKLAKMGIVETWYLTENKIN